MTECPNCGRTETDQPGSACDVCGAGDDAVEHRARARRPGFACVFCGVEVLSLRHGYQRVVGWTRPRAAGGANQITGRELRPEYACERCVDKLRQGYDPGQAALV